LAQEKLAIVMSSFAPELAQDGAQVSG